MPRTPRDARDPAFEELDVDALDQVHGGETGPGEIATVFSLNGSLGFLSASVMYSPGNGW